MHDTYIVDKSLIVLFFGLFFVVPLTSGKFPADALEFNPRQFHSTSIRVYFTFSKIHLTENVFLQNSKRAKLSRTWAKFGRNLDKSNY